jgi:hypothetical protein
MKMPTEDEARTKWCPFSRVPRMEYDRDPVPGQDQRLVRFTERPVAINRLDTLGVWPTASSCVGAHCMAWRWADPTTPHLDDRNALGGYCGLASVPRP